MATSNKHLVILVGVSSPASELALDRALIMTTRQPNAQLHVVSVGHAAGSRVRLQLAGDVRLSVPDAVQELENYVVFRCGQLGLPTGVLERAAAHVHTGNPARVMARVAIELGANLVLLGTPGHRSLHGFALSTTAEFIRREVRVPVVTVAPVSLEPPVPQVQPLCPACAEIRRRTHGKAQWCARHSERHGPRHTYRAGTSGAMRFGGGTVISV